jgi:hypothetical protein
MGRVAGQFFVANSVASFAGKILVSISITIFVDETDRDQDGAGCRRSLSLA